MDDIERLKKERDELNLRIAEAERMEAELHKGDNPEVLAAFLHKRLCSMEDCDWSERLREGTIGADEHKFWLGKATEVLTLCSEASVQPQSALGFAIRLISTLGR